MCRGKEDVHDVVLFACLSIHSVGWVRVRVRVREKGRVACVGAWSMWILCLRVACVRERGRERERGGGGIKGGGGGGGSYL